MYTDIIDIVHKEHHILYYNIDINIINHIVNTKSKTLILQFILQYY